MQRTIQSLILLLLLNKVFARGSPFTNDANFVSFGRISLPTSRRRWRSQAAAPSSTTLMASASVATPPATVENPSLLEKLQRLIPSPPQLRRSSTPSTTTTTQTVVSTDETQAAIQLQHRLVGITQPIIPQDVWDTLTGTEFQQHPEQLQQLAQMGHQLAASDQSNEWIAWKVCGSQEALQDGHIHVWTGQCQKEGYGTQVPFIKTRSIVPFTAREMVDLLLDSSRVQTYNPWSMGRQDLWVHGFTKIVKNRTQPPLGNKAMVSTTLLHATPHDEDQWLVVSRSVGGAAWEDPQDADMGRSDILLGINWLQPLDAGSCVLTAVTHVYSPAVPTMLAERLGVKSAIKFVKDMRQLKQVAAQ